MIRRFSSRIAFATLGLAAALALGCTGRSPPDPSDPAAGREALQKALEAWKRGDTHEAFRQSAPSVQVVERAWIKGAKLIDFEIEDASAPSGYDVQFKTKLTIQDGKSPPSKQKAIYNVSTTPSLVIVRMEG